MRNRFNNIDIFYKFQAKSFFRWMIDNKSHLQQPRIQLGSHYAIVILILEVVGLAITSTFLSFVLVKQYGVFYSSPFQVGVCTVQYFMNKYVVQSKFIIIFSAIVCAIVCNLIVLILWIFVLVQQQIKQNAKNIVILVSSLRTLAGIISAGYMSTFIIEFSKISSTECNIKYDRDALILISSLAAGSFIVSLFEYIALLVHFREDESHLTDQKQKQSYQHIKNITNISEFNDSMIMLKKQVDTKNNQIKEAPVRQPFSNSKNTNGNRQIINSINELETNINVRPQKVIAKIETPQEKKTNINKNQRLSVIQSLKINIIPRSKIDQKTPERRQYLSQSKIHQNTPNSRLYLPQKNIFDDSQHNNYDETIFNWPQSHSNNSEPFFHPQQSFSYMAITKKTERQNKGKIEQIKTFGSKNVKSYKSYDKILEIIHKQDQSKQEMNNLPTRYPQNIRTLKAGRQIIQNYERRLNKI